MKLILKTLKWIAIVLIILIGITYATGNQFLLKGVWAAYLHGNNSATIGDAQFFSTRTIKAGESQPWKLSSEYDKQALSPALSQGLEEVETVAFLVVKNDEIVLEHYWDGYSDTSHSNSFSMAKSIITMLTQCAIQDGYLKNWDQKVSEIIPQLKGEFANELTLRHLSTMTAGLDFNEHYTNPFDITARTYYGSDVEQLLFDEVPVSKKPGSFEYQSGATQWLGLVVRKATGKSLAEYASEKLWKPMGATHDAWWHTDSEGGTELAFCCFNSNARDFARFGNMLLHKGYANGHQILDSSFVEMASQPFAESFYGHGFWMDDSHGTHIFYQRGILGQYIIVIPEYDLVVVRLGHHRGEHVDFHTTDFHLMVEETMALVGKN